MPQRSKWLDPRRISHGIAWRLRALIAKVGPGPNAERLSPPVPSGDHFRTAVLRGLGVEDISTLPPTERMWAEFRLTAVERGWNAVELLGGRAVFRRKRVLDVGCAYGGFLVAAAHAGAKEVVGIDIDRELLDQASLLLNDYRVTAFVQIDDITDPSLPDRIGRFDIVICNDVLEHVLDLEAAVANLRQLLAAGGLLFLEIPNGQALRYVESDGHYKLPGITMLEHTDAERWFRSFYQDSYPYRTFFYAPLDFYVAIFSRAGISLRLLNAPTPDPEAVADLAGQWRRCREAISALAHDASDKPRDLVEAIQTRMNDLDHRFTSIHTTASGSPLREERNLASVVLQTTFGLDSFLLVGKAH